MLITENYILNLTQCRFRRCPTPSDFEPRGGQGGHPSHTLGVPETAGGHAAAARVQEEEDAAAHASNSGETRFPPLAYIVKMSLSCPRMQ